MNTSSVAPLLTPALDRDATRLQTDRDLHKGLDASLYLLAGCWKRYAKNTNSLMRDVRQIEALAGGYTLLSNARLREHMQELESVFRRGREEQDGVILDALATIREAATRQLGLTPYPVQLACALALHRGCMAEFATGEGKTLAAAMAAVLAAWSRRPCHVITANDYLAERDADSMRKLYHFCGLKSGHVISTMEPDQRRAAYACDVTYTTGKEIVADFLRDRLRMGSCQSYNLRQVRSLLHGSLLPRMQPVMRGLHTAIVDEADNLLIDEAVTPVILSAPRENELFREACEVASALSAQLKEGEHYRCERPYKDIEMLRAGVEYLRELCADLPGFWSSIARGSELIRQALVARHYYIRGQQYVVEDDAVVIVDEFTGRMMPSRTWRDGLHQAVEVKEGLPPSPLSETSMRLSVQRFFRFYRRIAGMTGTGYEGRHEFWHIYGMPVVCIPTHRPVRRQLMPARYFATKAEKWNAVIDEIQRAHETGRPVLVGMRAVKESEALSARLTAMGLSHQVLNAVRHREEAQIISQAGQAGHITLATNMAGRGTDIKLGPGVVEVGGLYVLATETFESGRIDRQLYGRSARQGDPGSAVTFSSLEDEVVLRTLPESLRRWIQQGLIKEPVRMGRVAGFCYRMAQAVAEKRAFKSRKSVLLQDDWLEESMAFSDPATGF